LSRVARYIITDLSAKTLTTQRDTVAQKKVTQMTNTITTAKKLINSLNKNVAIRAEYENAKNKSVNNVIRDMINAFNLDHKTLQTKFTEAYFERIVATNSLASFDFINNSVKSDSCFNTKAFAKVASKLECISKNKLLKTDKIANSYCTAAVLTCLQKRDVESFFFTRDTALAMLSKAMRFEHVALSDLATQFNVSANTASTQVSSSFRTLEALNILEFDKQSRERNVVSNVNYDSEFVKIVATHYKIAL